MDGPAFQEKAAGNTALFIFPCGISLRLATALGRVRSFRALTAIILDRSDVPALRHRGVSVRTRTAASIFADRLPVVLAGNEREKRRADRRISSSGGNILMPARRATPPFEAAAFLRPITRDQLRVHLRRLPLIACHGTPAAARSPCWDVVFSA
jgi:hypothetical protein